MTAPDNSGPRRIGAGLLWRMALAFGVLAGLGELVALGWDKLIADKLVFHGRHVLWMAPLADVLLCALAAALVLLGARGRPTLRAAVSALSLVVVASWFFMFPTLHPLASLVLSVGIAFQIGRAAEKRAASLERLARRSWGALAAVLLLLVVGTHASVWWRARQATAALPDARAGASNVLLISLDTVRAESLGLYGYERPTTPVLSELAEQGVVFDLAMATSSWTLPSHASMFTGRFHHELSVNWHAALDREHPTLAEVLAERGYATAGFVANLNYCGEEVGLGRGFAHYEDYPISLGQLVLSCSLGRAVTNSTIFRSLLGWHENLNRKTAEHINEEFLGWLDGHGGRPFFAFLNYYDAHQPYLPPPEFAGKFGPIVPRTGFRYDTNLIEIEDWSELTPEQIRMEQDSYDAAIAYLDDRLGALFGELERRGVLQETLLIVTGDHGEQFGEHSLYNHGNSLYLPGIHVPMLFVLPGGVAAGTRVEAPVSHRDLPATVLELLGIDDDRLPGESYARYWNGEGGKGDVVLSEALVIEGQRRRGDMKSLIVGKHHYIRNGDGSEELYDIVSDPGELHDLTLSPQGRAAVKVFAEAVDAILKDGAR